MQSKNTSTFDILKTSIVSEIKRIDIMMIEKDINDRKQLKEKLDKNHIKIDMDRLNYILNKNKIALVKKETTMKEILSDLKTIKLN